MTVRIRLQRFGRRNRPFYRAVVADSRSPRDGKFIELVGTYNPLANRAGVKEVTFKVDRVRYWVSVGAQPSDRVAWLLGQFGILPPKVVPVARTKRTVPRKEWKEMQKNLKDAKQFHTRATSLAGLAHIETPPYFYEIFPSDDDHNGVPPASEVVDAVAVPVEWWAGDSGASTATAISKSVETSSQTEPGEEEVESPRVVPSPLNDVLASNLSLLGPAALSWCGFPQQRESTADGCEMNMVRDDSLRGQGRGRRAESSCRACEPKFTLWEYVLKIIRGSESS